MNLYFFNILLLLFWKESVPMIQQLKTYYGEDIKINEAVLSEDYSWF